MQIYHLFEWPSNKGLSDPNKTLKEEEKKDLNSNYSYSKIDHSKPDNNLFEDDKDEASERTSFNENMNVKVSGENLDPYILEKIKKKEFFIKKITGEGRVYGSVP